MKGAESTGRFTEVCHTCGRARRLFRLDDGRQFCNWCLWVMAMIPDPPFKVVSEVPQPSETVSKNTQ
ncbi:MAG: hypothetical protein C4315_04815 [Chloroflexota bacterium]